MNKHVMMNDSKHRPVVEVQVEVYKNLEVQLEEKFELQVTKPAELMG